MAIITLQSLADWTRLDVEDLVDDNLALKVIDQASFLVNEAAGRLSAPWSLDSADPELLPPQKAIIIAEQLAFRVYSNPTVLERRSVGPLAESFADAVLTGMALRPDEIEALNALSPNPKSTGPSVWVQPITGAPAASQSNIVPYEVAYSTQPRSAIVYPMGYPGDPL